VFRDFVTRLLATAGETIDTTKARAELGYRPLISVDEGLDGLSAV
jgi:nucleoside-diphosphate-sugar epimerase